MTNTTATIPKLGGHSIIAIYRGLLDLPESIPFSLIQLSSRVAIARVFWSSAQSKLASWSVNQQLFAMEYHVPLLSPEIAAPLATATEICGAMLVFFGVFARLGALALLGVVTVIQLLILPGNWAEHLMWANVLFLIISRGAGKIFFDYPARRHFFRGI